ncbi:MAG TPA: trypsin-like peptidase domain-containing protein [Candidatus Saccharimonadales bacterium]|nr:trypsin-like peptidase domain-containing protein [Candidatus Saccharimonadales bacterium]
MDQDNEKPSNNELEEGKATGMASVEADGKREKPIPLPAPEPQHAQAESPRPKGAASKRGRHPVTEFYRHKGMLTWLLGAIIVLALGFGGGWLGATSRGIENTANVTQQKVVLQGEAAVISKIAKDVGQSVVSVNVTGQVQTDNPYADFLGGVSGTQTQRSAGTGIILTDTGLIMTNRHVVPAGTTNVSVTLSDGTVFNDVKVVGRTKSSDSLDVAFLQVNDLQGRKLVPAKLGDSSLMKIGDPVVAIGNALGQFQNTVTSGIISGHGRSLQASSSDGSDSESLDDLFQTDAAINEGNSGGPLVNLDGEVIGMNTALASGSQNIGFAIPINDVAGLVTSVEQTGKLERPYLGVIYIPLTSDIVNQYNIKVSQGAYIPTSSQVGGQETVIADGPADQAGVKPGDVITKIDGVDIDQSTSLVALLGKHKVGDKVTLTIFRDGKTITKDVTLGTAPTDSNS